MGPVTVSLVVLIFSLEGAMMPSQARDELNTAMQKIGSHSYAIPRDMIDTIYKPDWSKVPNANPNWPHEPTIRLAVQWPDFAAAPPARDAEAYKGRMTIALSSLEENPLQSVDDAVKSLDSKGLKPRIITADYGLQELVSNLRRGTTDYIATTDDQARFFIRCDPLDPAKQADQVYRCDSKVALGDLNVDVNFTNLILPEWKQLFAKVRVFITAMQRD